MRAIRNLFDLHANFRIQFDEVCLHPFGREEVQALAIERVMHRNYIRPAIACAPEMPKALSLEQLAHFGLRHVFNFQHVEDDTEVWGAEASGEEYRTASGSERDKGAP